MKRYIFLDIDGVLNTGRNDFLDPERNGHPFDSEAVSNLGRIVRQTGAEIVISSSWRHMGFEKLREMWQRWGLPGDISGVTPGVWGEDKTFPSRGDEIKAWLDTRPGPVSYVVLDDYDEHIAGQEGRWIIVKPHHGISGGDADAAVAILNKRQCQ
jgi:hypothetical protein